MEYFFIYSAGGGAGDWNGLKRVWKTEMPPHLKRRVLLKFGDIFFNHTPIANLVKPTLWRNINNLRTWLYDGVNDKFVYSRSILLLDSGTSKIVNHIKHHYPTLSSNRIIDKFHSLVAEHKIIEKYVDIIQDSNIQEAVTFDIPNPFKIRTQSIETITKIFSKKHHKKLIQSCAHFSNHLYDLLGCSQERLLTTINGLWNDEDLKLFLSLLKYQPNKLAIGGLTRVGPRPLKETLIRLNALMNLPEFKRVHLLGCGGIKNVNAVKELDINLNRFSVDNSTPWNRAIDGNTKGTKASGYFDYNRNELHRISSLTLQEILKLHSRTKNPLFSVNKMRAILSSILNHQNSNPSDKTYEARALLAIHNHHVFRRNVKCSQGTNISSLLDYLLCRLLPSFGC